MTAVCKKFAALLLAVVLVLSLAVTASAATDTTYGVTVQKGKVLFTQNGVTVGTFTSQTSDITLTTDIEGDFLVSFKDATGKVKYITLGKQTSLTIEGPMDSLTLAKALNDKITVTLGTTANVTTLNINTPNVVTIKGKISTMNVTDAAKITVAVGASVTKQNVTAKKATVTVEKAAAGTTAKPAVTTKPAAVTKPSTTTNSTAGTVKLRITAIDIEDDDQTLGDLVEELNDHVEAYDSKTKDYIDGTAAFTSSKSRTVSEDGKFNFTFTPDDSSYAPVKGTISIYIDRGHGDIILHIDGPLVCAEGTKLGDLTDALNDAVWAEDDNGDIVEGKAKFTSSRSSTVDERSYKFEFKPKLSRYNSEDGKIDVKFE